MNQINNQVADRRMRLPVAFHRWFEDGAGWGCDDSIIDRLTEIARSTKSLILADERDEIFNIPIDQGFLVGVIEKDTNCPDTKAQARHPFILKACVVSTSDVSRIDSPDENWKNVVLDALLEFTVPRVRPDGGLYSVAVPEKPPESQHRKLVGMSSTEIQLDKKLRSMEQEILDMRRLLNRLRSEVDELREQRTRERRDREFSRDSNYDDAQITPARSRVSRESIPDRFSSQTEPYRFRRPVTPRHDESLIPGRRAVWLVLLGLAAVIAYSLLH